MRLVPVRFLNSSPARWAEVPAPCEAKDSLPGEALAAAMTSLTDLNGLLSRTTSTFGETPTSMTGVNAFSWL